MKTLITGVFASAIYLLMAQNPVPAAGLPTATTQPATGVGPTSANLPGIWGANGADTGVYVDVGLTANPNQRFHLANISSAVASFPISAPLSSLSPGQTYFFRAAASNSFGVTLGNVLSFTTLPTNALATSLVTSDIGATAASLRGEFSQRGLPGHAFFQFGTTVAYGQVVGVSTLADNINVFSLTRQVTGLTPNTTYHCRAACSNALGVTFGADVAFTTAPAVTPTAIAAPADNITSTGARLNGRSNPRGSATTVFFEVGPTTSYGSTTGAASVGAGTSEIAFSATIGGLQAGTTYHYRVAASNIAGIVYSPDATFTTAGPTLPTVVTLPADNVTVTGARFNGSANGNGLATTVFFQYGTTTNYSLGVATNNAPAGAGNFSFNGTLDGLPPGTYFYRAVAQTAAGTAFGESQTFTTVPLAIVQQPANAAVCSGSATTFTAAANSPSARFQWELRPPRGSFSPVAGATNASFTTGALNADTADHTECRVTVSVPGATVTSSVAKISVLAVKNPVLTYNFSTGLPPKTAVYGSAITNLTDGILELTPNLNSQMGAFLIGDPVPGRTVIGFTASFKVRIIAGSSPPADGFSFSWSPDLPNEPISEDGAGSGLRLSFDTYDNQGGEAPAIDVFWGTNLIAHKSVPIGFLLRGPQFVDVSIRVTADGYLDLAYDCESVFGELLLPDFRPQLGARFGIGARTGGLRESHAIDDFSVALEMTASDPTPHIADFIRTGDRKFRLIGTGRPGRNYSVESTTNFVDWIWRTNVVSDLVGTWGLEETEVNLTTPHRFYRALGISQLPPNLVSWYRAENNFRDSFGPWHGSSTNGVGFEPGKDGLAFVFSGTNNTVELNAPAIAGPWTAAVWVKRVPGQLVSSTLLSDPFQAIKLEQYGNTNRLIGFTRFGVRDYYFNYSATIDTWVHLAIVGTGTNTLLYVDGNAQDTNAATINLPRERISRAVAVDQLSGSIDELTLFDRALTPEEISQVRDATRAP